MTDATNDRQIPLHVLYPPTDACDINLREPETRYVQPENNVHSTSENSLHVFDLITLEFRETGDGHLLLAVERLVYQNYYLRKNNIRRSMLWLSLWLRSLGSPLGVNPREDLC
jgi:hypothetical protein